MWGLVKLGDQATAAAIAGVFGLLNAILIRRVSRDVGATKKVARDSARELVEVKRRTDRRNGDGTPRPGGQRSYDPPQTNRRLP